MENKTNLENSGRRRFLGKLAAAGLVSMAPGFDVLANQKTESFSPSSDPEEIFKKITGKHRVVFDAPKPHEIYPFAWPRVFLLTNEMTGTGNKDCSVMVVLRHAAIGYAMEDRLWAKYNLGEVFQANDPETGKPATRNPFWKPRPGAYKVPGVGELLIGVDQLQANGVLFCVCEAAMTVYSAVVAGKMNMDAKDIKNEWVSGILPGIQPVPSGVWALGRAQEHKCAYIFAG
ncbi:MAG: hypothetical protein ACO25B_02615 [Chitinophagaceae bacterium]